MQSELASDNSVTLLSYKTKLQEYISSTPAIINDAELPWIDRSLGLIPRDGKILELGSGFGRNAAHIRDQGYDITCTDAVAEFVSLLQDKGFDARPLDALTDDFGTGYDLLFANGVLMHFTHDETRAVLGKAYACLNDGGVLAFSVKQGDGSAWSEEKLGAPRYFRYWQPGEIKQLVTSQGFAWVDMLEGQTSLRNASWLYVIARKPGNYLIIPPPGTGPSAAA